MKDFNIKSFDFDVIYDELISGCAYFDDDEVDMIFSALKKVYMSKKLQITVIAFISALFAAVLYGRIKMKVNIASVVVRLLTGMFERVVLWLKKKMNRLFRWFLPMFLFFRVRSVAVLRR